MTWWSLRQHRAEVGAIAALAIGIAALMVVAGLSLHAQFAPIARCFVPASSQQGAASPFCSNAIAQFLGDSKSLNLITSNLLAHVSLLGAFLGAPLFAREFEQGTWQLAWMQSVSRTRWWLTSGLVLVGAITVAILGAVLAITWFREPLDAIGSPLTDAFDLEGVVPLAAGVYSFALGAAAGLYLRRVLPALGLAVVLSLATGQVLAIGVRPHYLPPQESAVALGQGAVPEGGSAPAGAWVVGTGIVDSSGNLYTASGFTLLVDQAEQATDSFDFAEYARERGFRQVTLYHPKDRFWTFQLIESSIYLALAVALGGLVTWRVRRGIS